MTEREGGGSGRDARRRARRFLLLAIPLVALALGAVGSAAFLYYRSRMSNLYGTPEAVRAIGRKLIRASSIPSPDARSCAECHRGEYDLWLGSQHARANRLFDPREDGRAFVPNRRYAHGSFVTEVGNRDGRFELAQTGPPDGGTRRYHPISVIGIEPLRQYLVPFPGGRLQVFDMAYDPAVDEWFNSFGEDDRQPHEWGHWTRRSMTWNVQCAFCHTTNLKKNYDPATDSYATTWDAMGVSCAQCHGPMPRHRASPKAAIAEEEKIPRALVIDNCASCHCRREELTPDFRPGERFFDHYRPTLVDAERIYHADGQILDEDFEYGSFLMSRMGQKGVICLDCHDPHGGKVIAPVDNNALCMRCHSGGQQGAPVIEPVGHGHHRAGSEGNLCVECHMARTKYMVRDPRRDHGFVVPDPVLTRESGIPNSCNRCHVAPGEDVEWAIGWASKWYGEKLETRRSRARARAVTRAWRVEDEIVPELLGFARGEEVDGWRSALVSLLAPWAERAEVRGFLREMLGHTHPAVRSAAVRALAPLRAATGWIRELRADPSRVVRLDVAWATLQQGVTEPGGYDELRRYFDNICDQPAGALRQAQLAQIEERPDDAVAWARRAAEWDPTAQANHFLGRILHATGNLGGAEAALRRSVEMDPSSADHRYALALLCAERGKVRDAAEQLQKCVELDARFGRAWYNLGLARSQLGDLEGAIAALAKAEERMGRESPDPSYARATVHLRRGERDAARAAAERALRVAPEHGPTRELLGELSR